MSVKTEPYSAQGLNLLDRDTDCDLLTGEIEIKPRRDRVVPTEFVEDFSETHGNHTMWIMGG